jgi:hypothetical protein
MTDNITLSTKHFSDTSLASGKGCLYCNGWGTMAIYNNDGDGSEVFRCRYLEESSASAELIGEGGGYVLD